MATANQRKWFEAVHSIEWCVLCGSPEGIQAAHRNEGKATRLKTADHALAALCMRCHMAIDQYKDMTRDESRALWNEAYWRTMDYLIRSGRVNVL